METDKIKFIIKKLIDVKKTISVMESCTGGAISSCITNISGSSEIFKFGAVTYSNEHKIKFGVSEETIKDLGVYSPATAREMSKAISNYADSDYGIGITGQLGNTDFQDHSDSWGNTAFISIYNKETDSFLEKQIDVISKNRVENKEAVVDFFVNTFLDYII